MFNSDMQGANIPNNNLTYDFAIVGCGMAGASVAYELSSSGASVIVLETEPYPAFHTTGRSAAFYMEAYGNATVRKITQASRCFFDSPPEGFTKTPLLKPCGALYLARDTQLEQLNNLYTELRSRIAGCKLVGPEFLQERIPQLKHNIIKQGFWEPQSMEIDVAALIAGYIKLAKKEGADFYYKQPVEHLRFQKNHWLINHNIKTKTIINAAGAWANQLGDLAGSTGLKLTPKKRTVCIAKLSKNVDVSTWPLTIDIEERFYFKPEGSNLLITPADETVTQAHDAQAGEYEVALGIARVQEAIDVEVKQVTRQWAGLRTFSEDKSPVVGFDKTIDNFFWLAGQGGYGIQMAPALAKIACTLALQGKPNKEDDCRDDSDISIAISPKRFS